MSSARGIPVKLALTAVLLSGLLSGCGLAGAASAHPAAFHRGVVAGREDAGTTGSGITHHIMT